MTPFGPMGFVLFAALGVALLATFFLWHPVAADVKKRVDVLVGGVAERAREDRAELAAPRSRIDILKQFFMLGMPRKWGVGSRPLTFLLAALTAGAVTWLVCQSMIGLPLWLTVPLMVVGGWSGAHILARLEQGKSDERFTELFPEAIDMIVRMLRAGLPVSGAIRTVAKEAQPPVNRIFASLADQIAIGMTFEDALGIGSERIGLPDFRFFAAAVALQHTTGGNLVTTLETLSEIIRRRRAVRLKARAATAEVRMSAYVLGAMPFCVFGALIFVNPDYLKPLVTDSRGNVMLFIAIALLASAFLIMRRMMRSVSRT